MPGTFSKASRPRRPGAYVNFEAITPTQIPPSTGSVVAIPITHDWGPFKRATLVASYSEFLALFGDTATPGKLAVRQAFQGEGLPGRSGAGGVIVYRFGIAGAAKATKTLNNATVPSLKLDAKYEGTKGNGLTVTVQVNSVDATAKDLILYLAGVEVERYTRLATDIAGLAAYVNQFSRYVVATSLVDGVALANVTNSAFASGNDGTPIDASAWTAVMSALEFERFGFYAPFDLTDPAILSSTKTWVHNRNAAGQRFIAVVGGGPGLDTVALANTRSASLNDPSIVNVGGFSVSDDTDSTGVLTTSQLAPRVAGVLAARGENRSITFARMAGLSLIVAPTSAEVDQAFDAGTLVATRDSNVDAPVRIEKALTTFTTKTDPLRSYVVFRNPKFVHTMCGLETEITEYAEGVGIIGELGVNDKTRLAIVAEMNARMRGREEAGVIQPGWTVQIDQDPPPTDDDEFVALRYSLRFMRTVEQVYSTVVVA